MSDLPDTLQLTHNSGFFSCCSIRLHSIVEFFNVIKTLPRLVDTSKQFEWYKLEDRDITFDYFEHYDNCQEIIKYHTKVEFYQLIHQYIDYKKLDFKNICPLVRKYFTPSVEIKNIVQTIETKYNITDYTNICALFYRGNDKITETGLSNYKDVIEKAKKVLKRNPNVKFLIQSDETEFIETMTNRFPSNSFYFKDEIRHMYKQESTVDKVFKHQNFEFSKYFLAITIIMSKCNYVVCGSSGNCSLWIVLYRENANNVYQFSNNKWV